MTIVDITKIHGYDAPAVTVVIGGSPCQDLSQAGEAVWASEIEELPIAATKRRFGGQ